MTAKKPRWFPFDVEAFLSSGKVALMSPAAAGGYVFLLCHAWRQEPGGTLPNDDAILAIWSRLGADGWAREKPSILAAFREEGGRLIQPTLRDVHVSASQIIEQRRSAGKASAAARSNRTPVQQVLNERSTAHVIVVSESGIKNNNNPVEHVLNKCSTDVQPSGQPSGPVSSEPLSDKRMEIITALTGCRFGNGEAIRLAATPGLTIERLEWLIDEAKRKQVAKPKSWIAQGIVQGWEPEKGPLDGPRKPQAPMRMGAWNV